MQNRNRYSGWMLALLAISNVFVTRALSFEPDSNPRPEPATIAAAAIHAAPVPPGPVSAEQPSSEPVPETSSSPEPVPPPELTPPLAAATNKPPVPAATNKPPVVAATNKPPVVATDSIPIIIEKSTTRGRIVMLEDADSDRDVVSDAPIAIWRIDEDNTESLLYQTRTDDDGMFSIPELKEGIYRAVIGSTPMLMQVIPATTILKEQERAAPKALLILMPKQAI